MLVKGRGRMSGQGVDDCRDSVLVVLHCTCGLYHCVLQCVSLYCITHVLHCITHFHSYSSSLLAGSEGHNRHRIVFLLVVVLARNVWRVSCASRLLRAGWGVQRRIEAALLRAGHWGYISGFIFGQGSFCSSLQVQECAVVKQIKKWKAGLWNTLVSYSRCFIISQ